VQAKAIVEVYGTDGQSQSHGKCTEPMECAEQKPWEVCGTHGVYRAKAMECAKLERRKHSEPEAQLNVQADRRPTS